MLTHTRIARGFKKHSKESGAYARIERGNAENDAARNRLRTGDGDGRKTTTSRCDQLQKDGCRRERLHYKLLARSDATPLSQLQATGSSNQMVRVSALAVALAEPWRARRADGRIR